MKQAVMKGPTAKTWVQDPVEAYVNRSSLLWYNLFKRRIYCEYLFFSTVHPRLSEQVELKFLMGRSDTQKIRIIEEEHLTY